MRSIRRKQRRGNTLIEFALVSVFLVPLLIGTINIGMRLSHTIQTTQVSRDAGHMFVRQVDFSLLPNQDIIVRVAQGLGMTRTGGDGVVILTKIMYIGQNECTAGGLTLGECTNYQNPVITQRIVIGNVSQRASDFGTPPSNLVASDGNVAMNDYLTNPAVRATNFGNVLVMQPAELAYVSEAYFATPNWDFPTTWVGTGTYARTIY